MRELFLGLYFFLLFYLALYGLHIYWLIWLYYRNGPSATPDRLQVESLPMVTVQLPLYNERMVATRLIRAVAAFDWPRYSVEIQVLDDSTDDTSLIVADEVERLQAEGIMIHHIRRSNRDGYKAGALANGLSSATGDYVAVFDADNVPRPDFLRALMGYFSDPRLGLVQARWSFLNRSHSLLCRAQALFLDAHFFVEQAARSRAGLFMNFNGTAGIWRRQAIEDGGGWQADTLTEDLDLSYRVQMAGWKMTLAEDVDVPTELPASIRSFKTQQYRWARGAIETGIKVLPRILKSSLPVKVQVASYFHLTQKTMSLALVALVMLLIPALYIRLESGSLKLLLVDLPIFVAGTGSMSVFYGLAYRRQKRIRSFRNSVVLPMLSSLGVALAINNTLAIFGAVFSNRRVFVRTPKAGADRHEVGMLPRDYRIRVDHTVKAEMLAGVYSVTAIVCAASLELYVSIPFLMTFAFGFMYFVVQSVREQYA